VSARYELRYPTLSSVRLRLSRRTILWLFCITLLLTVNTMPAGVASSPSTARRPIPVLAYYYIWFDVKSWQRAKLDRPLLGPYSSDNETVMRKHIKWAKQAGIDGFIVSWKSTETLNRRLQLLIKIADTEDFKLSIIYQGLNFEREPLPVDRIAADLDYFVQHYAGDKAFDMFERPVIIWSGTWKFSQEDIARVTNPLRERVLILASERNLDGYQRLADSVDGNAYYWSSVDPQTFPHYQEKLDGMSKEIHAHKGLWIAPAAVGFDARLIGGSRVVERKDGATLRQQMDVANRSGPDAIGLISWNEFSENSHVEPSVKYGTRYLEVLADILGATFPTIPDFDSSEFGDTEVRPNSLVLLGALAFVALISLAVIIRRSLHKPTTLIR
jgi:hypothetical protein